MKKAVELAKFKLGSGVNVDEFLKASTNFGEKFVKTQPGFVSRQLIADSDGIWADLVIWESMEAARAVETAMHQSEYAGQYMSFLDPTSVVIEHYCVEQ